MTDRHSVSLAPWGTRRLSRTSGSACWHHHRSFFTGSQPAAGQCAGLFPQVGRPEARAPDSREGSVGDPAPLLGCILADSAVSRVPAPVPRIEPSRPSSSLAVVAGGPYPSPRKELLRLGGVGAVFFFFLIKALNRLASSLLGSRRHPRGGRHLEDPALFEGSSGDTAGLWSTGSEMSQGRAERVQATEAKSLASHGPAASPQKGPASGLCQACVCGWAARPLASDFSLLTSASSSAKRSTLESPGVLQ